mgnify:CR=1 FL=1
MKTFEVGEMLFCVSDDDNTLIVIEKASKKVIPPWFNRDGPDGKVYYRLWHIQEERDFFYTHYELEKYYV